MDRTPVVISGADARNSKLDNVEIVGGPGAIVVRGEDSSIYQDRVAANVDVDNLLLRSFTMPLRWRDGCTGRALECANITTLPGISLALARADGNIVVDECPYGNANLWACSAGQGRNTPRVLISTTAGQPMYDFETEETPTTCNSTCTTNATDLCYQGASYTCVNGSWAAQNIFNPTDVSASLAHPVDYVDVANPCTNTYGVQPFVAWPADESPPCAVYTEAFMSTGALLRGDSEPDLAVQVVEYVTKLSNKQRCSTIGCPGHGSLVLDGDNFWRCGLRQDGRYAEDQGYWEWYYHPSRPNELSSVISSGNHSQLPYVPSFPDMSMTATEVQQGTLRDYNDYCLERNGTSANFADCDDYNSNQEWLFVRLGAHFRLEIPNNPYQCLHVGFGNESEPTLLPCPPCLYGSSSGEVTMNRYGSLPNIRPLQHPIRLPLLAIPVSTDPDGPVLKANVETGLCQCHFPVHTLPTYDCDCSLQGMRQTDVEAQLGPDACRTAAGSLLAACDRLGAGLAAIDGTRADMARACKTLGGDVAELVGAGRGAGATASCVDKMLRVVTMGGAYVPGEELALYQGETQIASGFAAVTAKVVYQPHAGATPTSITAPHRTVINVTSFLAAFGDDL